MGSRTDGLADPATSWCRAVTERNCRVVLARWESRARAYARAFLVWKLPRPVREFIDVGVVRVRVQVAIHLEMNTVAVRAATLGLRIEGLVNGVVNAI